VDGEVLADCVAHASNRIAAQSDETSAVHVSVNTNRRRACFARGNRAGDDMLDLVKVAARKRRDAQNV
jgi:hypothetical protein